MEKRRRAKIEDVKNVLKKVKSGQKMISRKQWWNWIQPYRITLNGKSIPTEICNRIYMEGLVKSDKVHAGIIYLKLTDKGLNLIKQ